MATTSLASKKRWAKYRLEKGNPRPEDYEILGMEKPQKETAEKTESPKQESPKQENSKSFEGVGDNVKNSDGYFDSDFDSFMNDAAFNIDSTPIDPINVNEPTDKEREKKKSNEFKIKGYTLLILIDFIAPKAFAFIGTEFLKKDITPEQLKLDESEIKELTPLADEVAELIGIVQDDPVGGLVLGLFIIYGQKLIMA